MIVQEYSSNVLDRKLTSELQIKNSIKKQNQMSGLQIQYYLISFLLIMTDLSLGSNFLLIKGDQVP